MKRKPEFKQFLNTRAWHESRRHGARAWYKRYTWKVLRRLAKRDLEDAQTRVLRYGW